MSFLSFNNATLVYWRAYIGARKVRPFQSMWTRMGTMSDLVLMHSIDHKYPSTYSCANALSRRGGVRRAGGAAPQ